MCIFKGLKKKKSTEFSIHFGECFAELPAPVELGSEAGMQKSCRYPTPVPSIRAAWVSFWC